MYKKIIRFFLCILIFFFLTEAAVRLSGINNYPLVDANSTIGYIPKPSQSGSFLWKNDWHFNSISMQNDEEFFPSHYRGVLLIGDSIVSGGNPFKKNERLAPQLSRILNEPVWSISAGSWSLRNELIYLRMHPDVVAGSNRIIFILNSGDFGEASSWSCEFTHPRNYSLISSVYIFRRYIYNWGECSNPPVGLQVASGNLAEEFKLFLNTVGDVNKITIFLYPDKNEVINHSFVNLEGSANTFLNLPKKNFHIYNIGNDPRWSDRFYRDSIHPSALGNEMLANIIYEPNIVTMLKK